MTDTRCPECARRAHEEQFLEQMSALAEQWNNILERKKDQASRLIAAGFEIAEISEMTGLREDFVSSLAQFHARRDRQ